MFDLLKHSAMAIDYTTLDLTKKMSDVQIYDTWYPIYTSYTKAVMKQYLYSQFRMS